MRMMWAKTLDNAVWGMVKKALRLPRRTVTSFFYVPWRQGELGLSNVKNDLDVGWASQVFKYLTSKDPKVMMMCARRLKDTLSARERGKGCQFWGYFGFSELPPGRGRAPQEY